MKYQYTIPGPPTSLKRPRFGKGFCYDSQKGIKKSLQSLLIREQKAYCFPEGPLYVSMRFYMPIPASWSKKKQAAALGSPHDKMPDIDNLVKFILDVGNEVLWEDDRLIFCLDCIKIYDNNPRTEIEIWKNTPNPTP